MIWQERILSLFRGTMETPKAFGGFHVLCLCIAVLVLGSLYLTKEHHTEKHLNVLLAIYGFGALILEIIKQLIWTYSYDPALNEITMNYQWYIFPFQLCSTPMYCCLICLFAKKDTIQKYLFPYMSFVTILGSIAVILVPSDCFVADTWVNIQTMWLHIGSFVVSAYLIMTDRVQLNIISLKNALVTFVFFVAIAVLMNVIVFKSDILGEEVFNMFYISPYFESNLPVFNTIQRNVPYPIFLFLYVFGLSIGACIILMITKLLKRPAR